MLRRAYACLVLGALASGVDAQTIEDAAMMRRGSLCTGFLYSHDSWDRYWEGELLRTNGNIGTLTTQSVAWMGNYGVTDRLNVVAMVPYVWTEASQGVLRGVDGFQDVTLAVKYRLFDAGISERGRLSAIVVGSAGAPTSDYTPDFYPLSIGSKSRRAGGRFTLDFHGKRGFFVSGSTAYTFRDNVTLDRPAYFTEDQLFLTDEVAMPNVFEYSFSAGYRSPYLHAPVTFTQQLTQGGSDIRRQDMPFVSNRMNFSKLDAVIFYSLPKVRDLGLKLVGSYTVDGRNVGRSLTLTAGFMYTFHF
jgi:hypothetical protein